uniref:CHASE2 domain-containing protein n=1 Tax=uncultured bacterium contig00086 TaxID=1181559 RepID=A0A806KG94_9BACT|nr:hypothetical protein [uncultured bacterium contig00086]
MASFFSAAGIAALICFLLEGPRLGPLYDFLLRRRSSPPVAREILIIDIPGQELGDEILEPGAASTLLNIMTEMNARSLIIQVPILGSSAGGTAGEAEILYRFDEEFSILSNNIRNLFDAIRTGSIAPREAARYVGELVELSEKGKERLVSALVRRDAEGIIKMERAAAFFGDVRRPGDLRVQLITAGEEAIQPVEGGGILTEENEYSRARRDRDGVLRRVAPLISVPYLSDAETNERNLEHIIYGALKTRFRSMEIDYSDTGPVLIATDGPNGMNRIIPLDRSGAIIFEIPRGVMNFRRISISDFMAYDEADRNMRRLLSEYESLGIFRNIEGEKRPDFLYDFALSLREELSSFSIMGQSEEFKQFWIESRKNYFGYLDDFLYGPAEVQLIRVYEMMIADEPEDSSAIPNFTGMRDSTIEAFSVLREKYSELMGLREKLDTALSSSFCILGRGAVQPRPEEAVRTATLFDAWAFTRNIAEKIKSIFVWPELTDVEASALLANSILTGRVIKPGQFLYLLIGSLASAFLICFVIKSFGMASTLGAGFLLTLLAGAGFSFAFLFTGIWLDPLAPIGAGTAGVLVSFLWITIAGLRYSRRFRLAYGPYISRQCLKGIIRAGKPLPSQSITVKAAMIAIKNTDPAFFDNTPAFHSRAVLAFHKMTADIIKKAGGTIIGLEEDIVTFCFGSPLERVFLSDNNKASPYEANIYARDAPAIMAVNIVTEIAGNPECEHFCFGLDAGNCSFAWSPLSGYFALGAPVQKAKLLSRIAGHYNTRIIISSEVNEAVPDLPVKKLTLRKKDGTEGEVFYSLMAKN